MEDFVLERSFRRMIFVGGKHGMKLLLLSIFVSIKQVVPLVETV